MMIQTNTRHTPAHALEQRIWRIAKAAEDRLDGNDDGLEKITDETERTKVLMAYLLQCYTLGVQACADPAGEAMETAQVVRNIAFLDEQKGKAL